MGLPSVCRALVEEWRLIAEAKKNGNAVSLLLSLPLSTFCFIYPPNRINRANDSVVRLDSSL